MAWRIHDSVQRGEIDNRERGVVRGTIWLHGVSSPVTLQLRGNAHPDLAGCLLTFQNPAATFPMRTDADFSPIQHGMIGDLTASRKVRVPDVPLEEFIALRKAGQPAPEHWANCLYLEWFSEANGRVVIESADFRLNISTPTWQLTPEEEEQRRRDAAAGFTGFMGKLSEAIAAQTYQPPPDKEWDEFDYEKLMRESDARTDKYIELYDKYEDHPERERIIAQEMGWESFEEAAEEEEERARQSNAGTEEDSNRGESKDNGEESKNDWLDVDEINRITAEAVENPPVPDPATEGVDWVRTDRDDVQHPLALRAFNGAMGLWRVRKKLTQKKRHDADLGQLISEFQITSAKLAGALNSLAYGRDLMDGAFVVACLKRALDHLHATQSALEKTAVKKLLTTKATVSARAELFAIREEILRLMDEFRRKK